MDFINNYIQHHPNKQLLMCDLSNLIVVVIASTSYSPMNEQDRERLRHDYLKNYGLACFDKYDAVIGGYMMLDKGPSDDVKFVALIDSTVRGLNLARSMMRHDRYTEYIPTGILEESSLYWFRYYCESYCSLEDIDDMLSELDIKRESLGWQYLEREFRRFEEFEKMSEDRYEIGDTYDFEGMVRDYVREARASASEDPDTREDAGMTLSK